MNYRFRTYRYGKWNYHHRRNHQDSTEVGVDLKERDNGTEYWQHGYSRVDQRGVRHTHHESKWVRTDGSLNVSSADVL